MKACLFACAVVSGALGDVVVDPSKKFQTIEGFGAANIMPWQPDVTAADIQTAFGAAPYGQTAGLNILRVRLPPDEAEFGLNLPTTRALAANYSHVKIIATPWSPPAALKTNNNTVGGYLRQDSYAAYAAHLKKFVAYMKSNGVDVYAVSVQNEPDIGVTYESCFWTPQDLLRFVKEFAGGLGTRLFAPESFHFNHSLSDPILQDAAAAANLDFVGGHIYGGGLEPYPLAVEKGKPVWMTEHLNNETTWQAALATGRAISDCMGAGMSAFVYWYVKRSYGPLYQNGTLSLRGRVMSVFSLSVPPGSVRVSVAGETVANMSVTAYVTPAQDTVVIAVNQNPYEVTSTVDVAGTPAAAATYGAVLGGGVGNKKR
ncbi:Glucuronoxylanase XynC [Diplonema papillatum]|nr:Glucuronoxylanase XynC [Diplonema papillatum]